ncbi:MAG: hypothetical protein PHX18_05605 [Candidatus Gastranaerophilales bacterium]|nr:hypothetical protein [Candidatus Gastranaerophilales bacterium]
MHINFVQNASFGGITKLFTKKYTTDPDQISEKQLKYPNAYAADVVGSLPGGWLKNVPYQDRQAFAYEIFDILGKHANLAREHFDCIQELSMESELRKAGLAVKKVSKIDAGSYGTVAGITVEENGKNKNYVYKVYRAADNNSTKHGALPEIAFAAYLNNHLSNHNFAKFYFGDITSKYMVCEQLPYISRNITQRKPVEYLGFISSDNHPANLLAGRNVDYGGFKPANELAANVQLRLKCLQIRKIPLNEREQYWENLYAKAMKTQEKDLFYMLSIGIVDLPYESRLEKMEVLFNSMEHLNPQSLRHLAIGLSSIMSFMNTHTPSLKILEPYYKTLHGLRIKQVDLNITRALHHMKISFALKMLEEMDYLVQKDK